jgi:hypothetical protein
MIGGHNKDIEMEQTNQFANLLSSLMMNGLPLLALDDYIRLSDNINANLGVNAKKKMMSFTGYKYTFGNFLDIRNREIRIVPMNCLSRGFVDYLRVHAPLSNVIVSIV